MDRLTLDQEGARTGQLFAHSLQMGDDTVTLSNIATMSVEKHKFRPYDTPRNRRTLAMYLGLLSLVFVFTVIAGGWWVLSGAPLLGLGGLIALALLVLVVLLGLWTLRIYWRVQHLQNYYRLRIGASDGQQLYLVDDNRKVLEQIRDALRLKIDNEDDASVGTFDLNSDTVALRRAGSAA